MQKTQAQVIRREDYRPPRHLVDRTVLRFDIADAATTVTAELALRRNPADGAGSADLVLDGTDPAAMELVHLAIDGRTLAGNEYRRDSDRLTVFGVPAACTLTVVTRIEPDRNTALEGLYRSGGMYCTQCEAEGFRRITFYPDRPDVMAAFTTTIVADASRYPTLLSNGNETARERLADGRVAVTWHDPFPKPSYLFALVAGDLAVIDDHYVTMSGRRVALRIFSEPHNIGQCGYAMDVLKRSMRWDEQRFGREYDLDIYMIVAVDSFNMGAMENKGLNVFNTAAVLARADTTTDAGFQRVETVVAHEYFHNWSGNRVTCRDWFQLSLKEGFTVFRDAEFSSDMGSRTLKRIESVSLLRSQQFAEDAGPMAHPIRPDSYMEIANFYTPTVYEKGAEVVRMLQTLLGRDGFRRGTDLYFSRHDGQAVTCEDFVRALEDANGVRLEQFRLWYSLAGTPVLVVREAFDAAAQRYTLTIGQRCPDTPGQRGKPPMHVPVAMGLLAPGGEELCGAAAGARAVRVGGGRAENPERDGTLILHVTEREQVFTFEPVAARPVASLLRGFSAPVKLDFERPLADLVFLAEHDVDGFSRFDAVQALGSRVVDDCRRDGVHTASLEALRGLFGRLLARALAARDDGEEKAVLAAMLALPGLAYLMELWTPVDVGALHAAREAVLAQLAADLADAFDAVLAANAQQGAYSPAAPDRARRALANRCLAYVAMRDDDAALASIERQLAADNMTDLAAAVRAAVDHPHARGDALRQRALADFIGRFRDEALVVDLWFSMQAGCDRPGGLARVVALEQHAAFDVRVPNKVRALYGAFSQGALANFHAADGSGYRFHAERVRRVDALNPQVAARLAKALVPWRRHEPVRAAAMRGALEELAARPLSRDVYELVTKALAEAAA
jgi:aminopeptidase N